MSMSFEIFPTNNYIPNNEEIVMISHGYFMDYLKKKDIHLNANIKCETRFIPTDILERNDKLVSDGTKYEAFIINNLGQALVLYHNQDDLSKEFWEEEINSNIRAKALKNLIDKNIMLGYSWSVKRTMGQPAIINIYYGFLALAIAYLTDGLIYSDDGAWEYSCFPLTANDFQDLYLDVSKLKDNNIKEFINKCLLDLKTESEAEK